MTVLTWYSKNYGGGCFLRLCRVIRSLQKQGVEVHYISCGPFPIPAEKTVYHRIPFPTWFFLIALPFVVFWICLRYRIRTFFVFGAVNALGAFAVKVIPGVRIVTFVRGDLMEESRSRGRSRLLLSLIHAARGLGLKISEKIITVSSDLRERLIRSHQISSSRIDVIPNAVSSTFSEEETARYKIKWRKKLGIENHFVIGTSGRFKPVKRVDLLLQTFAKLKEKNTILVLIGDGPSTRSLKILSACLGIRDRVIFTGWEKEAGKMLAVLDLFVICSDYEGSPSALLEALSLGIPSIGSSTGGISEILEENTLMFQKGAIGEMKTMLEKALQDNAYYQGIRDSELKHRSRLVFDWDQKITEKILTNSEKKNVS